MKSLITNKGTQLFFILGGFFITNALVAEFIGVKIFSLEDTLGIESLHLNLYGVAGSVNLSAGVLLWPIVFVMTDVINEYFGLKGVRLLSYFTVILIIYSFVMIFGAIGLEPANFWILDYTEQGIPNMQDAFKGVFGQGLWIIVASIIAFLVGQLIDVLVFQRIKRATGEKKVWLRATGSTLISQLFDTVIVLYIAFVIGQGWEWNLFLAVATVNYSYKLIMAILLTPVIYGMHFLIDKFLGEELAHQMKSEAARYAA